MKRRALALAVLLVAARSAPAEVRYASFESGSVARSVAYAVELPPSYATSDQAYPVLYFLHGLFENHTFWEKRGLSGVLHDVRSRGEIPELIVVSIDGGNSLFINSALGGFEDLFVQDLIGHVEATYRVIPARHGRALLGFSTGGHAALRVALKRPDVFQAVAAHSAMLLERIPADEEGLGLGYMTAFRRALGSPINPGLWAANNPLTWADRAGQRTPALYFDCGSEDRYGVFQGNRALHARLEQRKVPHQFSLYPGDHDYGYLKSVLDKSLRFVAGALRAATPSPPSRR